MHVLKSIIFHIYHFVDIYVLFSKCIYYCKVFMNSYLCTLYSLTLSWFQNCTYWIPFISVLLYGRLKGERWNINNIKMHLWKKLLTHILVLTYDLKLFAIKSSDQNSLKVQIPRTIIGSIRTKSKDVWFWYSFTMGIGLLSRTSRYIANIYFPSANTIRIKLNVRQ